MAAVEASVTQLQPGTELCFGMLWDAPAQPKQAQNQEQGARPSRRHQMGTDRALQLTWKHLQPAPHPACLSLFFCCFYSRKLCSLKKPGCPKLYLSAHTPEGASIHTGLLTGSLGRATKHKLSPHIENLFSSSERSFKKPTQFPLKRNSFYAPA